MAEITAATVKKLREMTDLSMMDCKNALVETAGDFDKAIELLKKKYKGKLETRSDRETGQGRIGAYIAPAAKVGAIVEVRCESAPVAKNEHFVQLSNIIAQAVTENGASAPAPDDILKMTVQGKPVSEYVNDVFSKLQEVMKIARARRVEGAYLASYVHFDGRIGCLVALDAKPADEQVAKDLCMHVAFSKPKAFTREHVSVQDVEAYKASVKEELVAQKKPEQIHDKIITGKLNSFYAERVLPEQEHTNPKYEKKSVIATLQAVGTNQITDMVFFEVGVAG